MSDREDIIRELERADWIVYESGSGFTAAHADAQQPIKFGGKRGWNLQTIRRDATLALGKTVTKSSARRRRLTAAAESKAVLTAKNAYIAGREAQEHRDIVRAAVIRRTNELRDISRLMQPG
jgi:hypothetical protein